MENKSEKFINICLSTDNNYVQHCVVMMASILKNCGNDYKVRFFILDGGISEENKRNIKKLAKIKDFVISYYDMTKIDFSDLPLNRSRISVATYYRLYLLDILPKDIKKLIYLDCDIVVKTDIAELWETDVSGYYAGVVEDEGGKTQQKRLGLPFDYKYFNAGVILFNLEELRTFDFKESCLKYYENNKDIIILQDQDILNGVFYGKCKFLNLRWNVNARMYLGNIYEHFYTDEEVKAAKNNIGIIHYTDVQKPWFMSCNHPLQKEYWNYLKLTPFANKYMLYLLYKVITCILGIKVCKDAWQYCLKVLYIPLYKRVKKDGIKKFYILGIKVSETEYVG